MNEFRPILPPDIERDAQVLYAHYLARGLSDEEKRVKYAEMRKAWGFDTSDKFFLHLLALLNAPEEYQMAIGARIMQLMDRKTAN